MSLELCTVDFARTNGLVSKISTLTDDAIEAYIIGASAKIRDYMNWTVDGQIEYLETLEDSSGYPLNLQMACVLFMNWIVQLATFSGRFTSETVPDYSYTRPLGIMYWLTMPIPEDIKILLAKPIEHFRPNAPYAPRQRMPKATGSLIPFSIKIHEVR